MKNSKYDIIPSINNLLKKDHPLHGDKGIIKKPDLKELSKQNLFPLTSLHGERKESLLNKTSIASVASAKITFPWLDKGLAYSQASFAFDHYLDNGCLNAQATGEANVQIRIKQKTKTQRQKTGEENVFQEVRTLR